MLADAHRKAAEDIESTILPLQAQTFEGFTGRYMYHCHILEHEDHDMMRPFIVMPAAALEAMDMPEMWRPFFIEEGQDQ